jgi:hypothetical protein
MSIFCYLGVLMKFLMFQAQIFSVVCTWEYGAAIVILFHLLRFGNK